MSEQLIIGKYTGPDPTVTEEESGTIVEIQNRGPMKPDSPGHLLLWEYRDGERMTSYEASHRACGDWHGIRREIGRLEKERGFVVRDSVLPNPAPRGRPHVHAYVITDAGKAELIRLGKPPDAS